ncbi:MAG: hypothetical protein AAGC67_17640 [Myxococcota bacterium]
MRARRRHATWARIALLGLLTILGLGCTRKHVATPDEVRANHDPAWQIESLPGDAVREGDLPREAETEEDADRRP